MEFDFAASSTLERYRSKESLLAFSLLFVASCLALFLWFAPVSPTLQVSAAHPLTIPQPNKKARPAFNTVKKWQKITVTVHHGDSLAKIFQQHRLNRATLIEVLKNPTANTALSQLKPLDQLDIFLGENKQLERLTYHHVSDKKLVLTRHGKAFTSKIVPLHLEPHVHFAQGTVTSSLYQAGLKVGLSDKIIEQLTEVLAWEIDFARNIHPGDSFAILYNDYYLGDKKVRTGEILAATFTNQGKAHTIMRYTNPKGESRYFTPDGRSVRTAFIRTPVKYHRISSRFTLSRKHPILHKIRRHTGVDYAAAYGTPIKASGDGVISFVGRNGGYGNMIKIQHGRHYTTVYAHLSRFAKNTKKRHAVKQGQIIGYVGQTGLATGPHLHYEFRIDNKFVNPIKVRLPKAKPIAKQYRKSFQTQANTLLAELRLYQNAYLASHHSNNHRQT